MWVKICGLTSAADARAAVGADALGFVFARSSPRYLPRHSPNWHEWVSALHHATRVLVLTAPEELPVQWRCFDALQWVTLPDATPTPELLRWLPELPLWIAFRLPPTLAVGEVLRLMEQWTPYAERFVLDTYHPAQQGGTGLTHDWQRAAAICAAAPKPTVLAGGLTPENVASAIQAVRPAGVDVSSGVESAPGRKDPEKVRAFIHAAKTALGGARG
ncbi:MAG: phosphoribosylanthranilate isomerase [Armatimonadota bacterium]|nr:phosphoribosylanthranilate isomerase [Armatimonadota bacterium]